jgi:F-type H+-transporting ATPase subunit b
MIRIAGLALLMAGLASMPSGMAAQQTPAPQTQPGKLAAGETAPSQTNALPAQPGQVKAEEREEENIYRHTALIQKLANLFHLDVETTARLFEFINFAIIVLAIVIPLARFLPKLMRKRSITLSHNLENARKTTADANARLSAVEAQMSRLDEEIAKIRAQVEDESRQDEARIKASIEEEKARIVASAEQEIGAAAAHARRSLRYFAADIAIEQAARQLVLTPETDRALISEFIHEAQNGSGNGVGGAAKGGNK